MFHLPFILNAIGLVFYLFYVFNNKSKISRSTFISCLLLLLPILAAPIVFLMSLFMGDNPPNEWVYIIIVFGINLYPLFFMGLGALMIKHDLKSASTQ